MKSFKVTITLKNEKEIMVYLDKKYAENLVDQFYDLCSGQLDDNCFEIVSPSESGNEYILIKADEILYVQSKEIAEYEE
jgi:hypothetical protein